MKNMTPVGYKLMIEHQKRYEKAKKKDDEEKRNCYMKIKSKEICIFLLFN